MNTALPDLMNEVRRLGFGHLSVVERKLLEHFAGCDEYETQPAPSGTPVTLQPNVENATDHGHNWDGDRQVRGGLLRMLCLNKTARAEV
jgi:hypothetical protein